MGRHRHRSHLAVAAAVLSLGSSCEDPGQPLPSLIEIGSHLQVGVPASAPPVCAGTWPYLDRYVGVLKGIHGLPDDYQVNYYWLPELWDYDVCSQDARGCAYREDAYSAVAIEEHELVHAVRSFHGGSYSFIEEGAAEYWGADDLWNRHIIGETREAIESADGAKLPGEYYGRAGHFVSYLAREYGVSHVADLARRTEWKGSYDLFEQAFSEVYNASIGAVVEAYESEYPECGRSGFRSNEGVCSSQAPVTCVDGEEDLRLIVRLSCDNSTTIGPRDGEIVTYIVFDIPGQVAIWTVDGPQGGSAILRRCEGGCGFWQEFTIPDDGIERWIYGGRYVLRLSIPEGTEGEFQILVRDACLEPAE